MKYFFNFIFLLGIGYSAMGQTRNLVFLDNETKLPLTHVNVKLNGNFLTDSDKKGAVSINQLNNNDRLEITCIGYKSLFLTGARLKDTLFLASVIFDLQELQIKNPAIGIIKDVVDQKRYNSPYKKTFETYAYTKILFNLKFARLTDSLEHRKNSGVANDYISEIVSQLSYKRGTSVSEKVLESRNAGFEKTFFSFPVTDLQPFNFYENEIKIADKYYLNPVSTAGLKRYRYILEHTDIREADTTFVIHFMPKISGFDNGLDGILHIDNYTKAITEVYARPSVPLISPIEIKHQFRKDENFGWFPSILNYSLSMMANDSLGMEMKLETYLNPPDEQSETLPSLTLMRSHHFTDDDRNTYRLIDSLFKEKDGERIFYLGQKLLDGYLPLKNVDIDLAKIIDFNLYENFRLGFGLQTGSRLSKPVSFNGYLGYGFGDKKMKYGLGSRINFSDNSFFTIQYLDDIREIGANSSRDFRSQRAWVGNYFDKIKGGQLGITSDVNDYLSLTGSVSHFRIDPGYEYQFNEISAYSNTELGFGINLGLSRNSDYVFFGRRLKAETGKPTLALTVRQGLNIIQSDFNYTKLLLDFKQSFYTYKLGTTSYKLNLGWLDRALPLGLMFTGMGVGEKGNFLFMDNYFQTMSPNEFFSDRFVNLFFSHNFHNKIISSKGFNPDLIVFHHMGISNLKNGAEHTGIIPEANNHLFVESGLLLDKLLKVNYFNLFNIQLGAGAFYRYGYYSLGAFRSNFYPKISLTFSM